MHVSLDSALGRQRRLNSVGESVLQIAPSAAAAYSLRSLTGGDPKVVRVRRGSDNHEQDFTASEVSSGALTSFVNAQVVAPLDIQALSATGRDGDFLIAKAAYSLRSLGTRQATLAATGDTVARADGKFVAQVRRSSDNALKSFTAAEVTDGTLLSFVNVIQTVGTAVNGTGSFNNYTVTGASTTGFSADNSAGGVGMAGFPYVFKNEDVIVVKYTVTNFSSTSSLSPVLRGVRATDVVTAKTSEGTAFTANGTYTDTLTATADGTHLMFADGNTGSYTISDFEIVSHSSNGFVKTWYDQSVSDQAGAATGNHAVQSTAGSQPKIVNAGSLLNELDFDGTDDNFELTSVLGITSVGAIFSVAESGGGTDNIIIDNRDASGDGLRLFRGGSELKLNWKAVTRANGSLSSDTKFIGFGGHSGSSVTVGVNGGDAATSDSNTISVTSKAHIGARSFSSATSFWDGTMNEIIVYDSDQTDNRTAIEANIGETYSIDLPSGVDPGFDQVDGFVETWYDQSGNGNDAVQATASLQPKIVNAGSLIAKGLDFDGTDDFLQLESALGATSGQSIFGVIELDALDSNTEMILDNRDGNGDGSAYFVGANKFKYLFDSNSPVAELSASTNQSLVSGFKTSSDVAIGINGGTLDTASNTDTISVTTVPRIGARSFSSSSAFLGGEIAELIIYNADQTENRTAIETNINSHYSIF